jgi:translation initiation factor IF-3
MNNYNSRRNSYKSKSYQSRDRGPRRNRAIGVPEVRVIDSKEENQGIMKTEDALNLAKERGLDLVEVAPEAKPPVCKLIDYSKYLYRQNKKKRKQHQKPKEMKEFRFSPVIEQHDIDTRVRRAKNYLDKGHNVRVTIFRKGRHTRQQSRDMMEKVLTYFENYDTIEASPKEENRKLFITLKAGSGKDENNE